MDRPIYAGTPLFGTVSYLKIYIVAAQSPGFGQRSHSNGPYRWGLWCSRESVAMFFFWFQRIINHKLRPSHFNWCPAKQYSNNDEMKQNSPTLHFLMVYVNIGDILSILFSLILLPNLLAAQRPRY